MNCWNTLTYKDEGNQQQHYKLQGEITVYGYVYEVTCKINNKRYIGQHKSNSFDPNYFGSGTVQLRAIEKYGKDNFSIRVLQECNTYEELNAAEQFHISANNAVNSDEFYNLINYGEQCAFSESTRQKMSEAAKKRSNTPEFKARMSDLHKGKVIPPDVISKRVKTLKRNHELYGNSQKGKKLSRETVNKMIESRKGYTHSDETKRKISKALKEAFKSRDQYGNKNPFYGKTHSNETKEVIRQKIRNRVFVNNGEVSKEICKEDLENYLQNGFTLGRLPNKTGKRLWINKEGNTKLISENCVSEFLADGWKLGRK